MRWMYSTNEPVVRPDSEYRTSVCDPAAASGHSSGPLASHCKDPAGDVSMAEGMVRLPDVPVLRAKRKSPDPAVNVKEANAAFFAIARSTVRAYLARDNR